MDELGPPGASSAVPLLGSTGTFCDPLCLVLQRTQTLLKEYKERDKSSVFLDKRLGEYERGLSAEEKMLRRFALEQQVCGERSGRRLR